MCFKYVDDRFRGLASAEGKILPFTIDFDGRPYKLQHSHYRASVLEEGLIMRPNRARMSDKMPEELVFLRCNDL